MRHVMRTIDRGAAQLAGGPRSETSHAGPSSGQGLAEPADPRTGAPPANHAQAVDYLKWWVRQRTKAIDSAPGFAPEA